MTQDAEHPEVKRLRAEVARLTACLDRANDNAEEFERSWYLATDEFERLQSEQSVASKKPFRPDQKRMDAGDWQRASQYSVCPVCELEYWEHATVQGFEWVHRICDGKLVKL